MFDIGLSELLLVAVIALIVLGPERLPEAARTVGRWVGRARGMMNQLHQEIDKQVKMEELREKLRQEGDTLGVEKIQETVDSALKEAKKFEHLVNQDFDRDFSYSQPTKAGSPAAGSGQEPAPNALPSNTSPQAEGTGTASGTSESPRT